MRPSVSFELLADHPEWIPFVAQWRWDEWGHRDPTGSLETWIQSLTSMANKNRIPLTFVAVRGGKPVESATVEESDLKARPELTPWLSGVSDKPVLRSRVIAARLVRAVMLRKPGGRHPAPGRPQLHGSG